MTFPVLLAAVAPTNGMAATTATQAEAAAPGGFGILFWLLAILAGVALSVIIERLLYYHRVQIDSAQFLAGVRNVLKRDNVIEAISICDATPGPVSRLVKAAILNRDAGRERIQESIEEVGWIEVPRLEANLPLLATFAQIGPLVGLLGTLVGIGGTFRRLQTGPGFAAPAELFAGVWQALYTAGLGIAIAAVCYAAYNYLVARVNAVVLDMERASAEAMKMVAQAAEAGGANTPAKP
jgi:biopolymer transport protein ExbB